MKLKKIITKRKEHKNVNKTMKFKDDEGGQPPPRNTAPHARRRDTYHPTLGRDGRNHPVPGTDTSTGHAIPPNWDTRPASVAQ